MKVYCHFAVVGLSNTYLVGNEGGGDALLIDPSRFDVPLLNMIENNGFNIRSILITHNHDNHTHGIATILKIYDAKIYASTKEIRGFSTEILENRQRVNLHGINVESMAIRGHTSDSLIFRINHNLFTGDILSAGRIGTTDNTWAKANMIRDLEDSILPLPDETIIFPGHGPPSTLKIEKLTNDELYFEPMEFRE